MGVLVGSSERLLLTVPLADQIFMPPFPVFGDFLDAYIREFVNVPGNLAASTKIKYLSHIKNHIRPHFGKLTFAEINTRAVQQFLNLKIEQGLSWATRSDLRNLLGSIFRTAERWDMWEGKNPVSGCRLGRRRALREKRKLSVVDIRRLLDALPDDVRLMAIISLSCGLRISELLGLQWKHIDWIRGVVMVRQRWYRGDLDQTKTERSTRDVPMGHSAAMLREVYPGPFAAEQFVFSVKTKSGNTRSDCQIRRYFLGKAARHLGIYWPGFGWHTFRREAITALASHAGAIQAMLLAGHTSMNLTLLYGLQDLTRQTAAIEHFQHNLGLASGVPIP